MQSVTGSMDKGPKKLTPFEQAEYNIARFVLNVQLTNDLQDLISQSNALESTKKKYTSAIKSFTDNEENILVLRQLKRRLSTVESEIHAVDYLIQTVCGTMNED